MRLFRNYEYIIPLLLIFACVAAAAWYVVMSRRPIVSVGVRSRDGLPTISLVSSVIGHDPVVDFYAMSNKEKLWVVTLENDFQKTPVFEFLYGVIPAKGTQSIPFDNKPPRPLIDGELLYITVRFGCDSFLSAGMGEKGFEVRYINNGESGVKLVPTRRIPLE